MVRYRFVDRSNLYAFILFINIYIDTNLNNKFRWFGVALIISILTSPTIICSGSGTGLVYSLEEVTEGADIIAVARVKYEYTDYMAGQKITILDVLGYLKKPQTLNELTFAYRTTIKIGPFWSGTTGSYPTFQSGQTYILFLSEQSSGYTLHRASFGKYLIKDLDDPQVGKVQELLGSDSLYPVKTGFSFAMDDVPALIIAVFLMFVYRNEVLRK